MTRYNIAFATLMLMLVASPSGAVPIPTGVLQIQFTGLDLSYAGSTVSDAQSPAGGVGNPADADPLDVVEFTVNSNSVGSLTSDIFADVSIPDVTGLLSAIAPNVVTTVVTTPGTTPGYFDLLIGPSGSEYIRLETGIVTVVYTDVAGIVQFLFGGAVAEVSAQNLPFDITAGTPVTVSFSTQVTSKFVEGGVVESFESSGTGEINGLAVPEPAVCFLAGLGLIATLLTRPHD